MEKVFKSFEDLIPLFLEKMRSTGSSMQGPLTSDFSQDIPLDRPQSGKLRVLRISTSEKPMRALEILLWEMLFGKHFRVWHWFILFNFAFRQRKSTDFTACLITCLSLCRPKGRTINWFSNVRNIHATIRDSLSTEVVKKSINVITEVFPSDTLRKGILQDSFTAVETIKTLRKPTESARIGVGYKDKGILGRPEDHYDPTEINLEALLQSKDCWELSLERGKILLPEVSVLLPKTEDKVYSRRGKSFRVVPTLGPEDDVVVDIETRSFSEEEMRVIRRINARLFADYLDLKESDILFQFPYEFR